MRQYKIYQRSRNENREITIGDNNAIDTEIFIGTSKKNSEKLANIKVTCNDKLIEGNDFIEFELYIDEMNVKSVLFRKSDIE